MARCARVGFALAIAIFGAALFYVYSGRADVSALSPHWRATAWVLSTTMERAVWRNASSLDAPEFVARESRQRRGAAEFHAMCVGCHGGPGVEPDAAGKGLNPAPPDLAEEASRWSVAEIFWITKHGVRMTGMPGFGRTHDDEAIWEIAAFVARLPQLSPAAYRSFVEDEPAHPHASGDAPH